MLFRFSMFKVKMHILYVHFLQNTEWLNPENCPKGQCFSTFELGETDRQECDSMINIISAYNLMLSI